MFSRNTDRKKLSRSEEVEPGARRCRMRNEQNFFGTLFMRQRLIGHLASVAYPLCRFQLAVDNFLTDDGEVQT